MSLVLAVVEVESAFNAQAVSSAGAQGLMQVMPTTAARFGVSDAQSVEGSLLAGCRYLAFLLRLFEGDVALALAGYNAGEGAVMRHGRIIPPYAETQKYVPAVLAAWQRRLAAADNGGRGTWLRGAASGENGDFRNGRR
jgi:soluble lytic murein transglycosylase-like protein